MRATSATSHSAGSTPCPYNGSCSQREVWERLKAYEDTGLTPEEIKELLHDTTGPLHHKLGEWIDADTSDRLVVLPHDAKDAVYGGYISDVKGTYLEVAKELLAEQVAQCVKLAMLDKDMFVVDGDTVRWKLWIFPEEARKR